MKNKKRRNEEIVRIPKDDDDDKDHGDGDDQKIKKKEKKEKKKEKKKKKNHKRRKLNNDDDTDNVDSSTSKNDKLKENETLCKKMKKDVPEKLTAAAASSVSPENNDVTQMKLSKKKKKETKKATKKKRKREEEEKMEEQTSESEKNENGNSSNRWSNQDGENDSKGVERKKKKKDPKKKKKQEKQSKTKKTTKTTKSVSQPQSDDDDNAADTNADNAVVDYTTVAAKNARIVASFARECSNAERKAKSVCPPTITKRKSTKRPKIGHDHPPQEKEQQQQQQQHDTNNNNNDDSNDHKNKNDLTGISLLLFYQYIEPEWDEPTYESIVYALTKLGNELSLTGRMRCAKEGLNCTLTGTPTSIMEFQTSLQQLRPRDFQATEFKTTTHLPLKQRFPELKVLKVLEIVRYGLEGKKAPQMHQYSGVHLEPHDYHTKLAEANTVIIDVRNHYEAAIGRFVPPTNTKTKTNTSDSSNDDEKSSAPPPVWLDPKMRKSTEFPAWLDHDETKKQLQGKQVLMYCTGGIRCERASSLLKYKMDNDPTTQALGIQGVYQLQGGIDKYFKEFPHGGYWQGKNYVFDKRFAHAPPSQQGMTNNNGKDSIDNDTENESNKPSSTSSSTTSRSSVPVPVPVAMGKCESCFKPWDMYRGKRRCPTCGVPSLICKECFATDKEAGKGGGKSKLKGRDVRCELCVEQNIRSKKEYKRKDQQVIHDYETKMISQGLFAPAATATNDKKMKNGHATTTTTALVSNPQNVTRLVVKGMCRKQIPTVDEFKEAIQHPTNSVTHIVWRSDHNSGDFYGMGWIEMETAADATRLVSLSHAKKIQVLGRTVTIAFQPPNGKDLWPHPKNKV